MSNKVIGIGGIFFKSKNPEQIREWYGKHLGFNVSPYGTKFEYKRMDNNETNCAVWAPFKEDSNKFQPSTKEFMLNLIVDDLAGALEQLKKEGVEIVGELQDYGEYGKFAHIMDPEGNKIELWQPK
jgi:predicted enzyme related to lactoylglutathione lyase